MYRYLLISMVFLITIFIHIYQFLQSVGLCQVLTIVTKETKQKYNQKTYVLYINTPPPPV